MMMRLADKERLVFAFTVLASTALCAAASRHVLQGSSSIISGNVMPENVRLEGPFPSETPDECSQLCKSTEGCRGYRWQGQECILTIQLSPVMKPSPAPPSEPQGGNSRDPPPAIIPLPDATPSSPLLESSSVPQQAASPSIAIEDAPAPSPIDSLALAPGPFPASAPEASPAPAPFTSPSPTMISTDDEMVDGDGAQNPRTLEEIQALLLECQEAGSLAAVGAALAACSVIINRCPIPEEPQGGDEDPEIIVALSEDLPPAALEVLNRTLTESCRIETIQKCKNMAVDRAKTMNPECYRVLDIGPARGDFSAEGCENVQEANLLFAAEVDKICEVAPDDTATGRRR